MTSGLDKVNFDPKRRQDAADHGPAAAVHRTGLAQLARALAAASMACAALPAPAQAVATYHGSCDASAAIALDNDRFVVANDENNVLAVYRRGVEEPEGTLPLSAFLAARPGEEADIEGAAAIGDRIYWISSHGRNSKGTRQPARLRFFSTRMGTGQPPMLAAADHPYTELLRDLTEAATLQGLDLASAARLAAEANGGLNIEGLAATPDGVLLIGFRNPLRAGQALIVPLENPGQVVAGERARFGAPIELDLRGRGIRSFQRVGSEYLVVAGPTGDDGAFSLYRWSGNRGDAATDTGIDLGTLRPEALFVVPDAGLVQLLSDDGGVRVDGRECKSLPMAQQRFRSLTVPIPKR